MTEFIVSSILASIALTVVLNVTMRVFPGTSADARARQVFGEQPTRIDEMPSPEDAGRFRIYFPWRQIVMWSIALTVILSTVRMFS